MARTVSPDVPDCGKIRASPEHSCQTHPLYDHLPDPNDPQAWARYVEDFRHSAHGSVEWIAEYLGNIRAIPSCPPSSPAS